MPERRTVAVSSIAPHRPFADTLVDGVLRMHGASAADLAGGLIIVPNNRARTAVIEAFVRRSEKGLLLPRIVAIGDPELNERIGGALDPMGGETIPPAIDPIERELLLAKLLHDMDAIADGSMVMTIRLAADMARVIDQLAIEGKSLRDLKKVDDSSLSDHWDKALQIVTDVLKRWPKICEARGVVDLSVRRNRLLGALANRWRDAPPKGFVIAAGISMTAPVVAQLLRVIAQMPNGQVVLAGLDLSLADDAWEALISEDRALETHPQYHLRLLLDRMGVSRALVEDWSGGKAAARNESRAQAVSHAMAPAAFTPEWEALPPEQRRLKGVHALTLSTAADEAQVIALALRQAIETPEHRAALITPNRQLANRVSTLLKRWSIRADDSAGQPLSALPEGTLLLALADGVAAGFDPASLLGILKHPLVAKGETRLAWLDGTRAVDLALRGPKPRSGLGGITHLVESKGSDAAQAWWGEASEPILAYEATAMTAVGLGQHLNALVECATALAGEGLWAGAEGRAASQLLADLLAAEAGGTLALNVQDFAAFLRFQFDRLAVRPPEGGHPRIAIWGLLEAKLQSVDFAVLGGLNEGDWPQAYTPDPWLAPALRHQLNMPGLDYRIGVAAHDLVSAMGTASLLLTRAERNEAGPTTPSRFWLRLNTLAKGFDPPVLDYATLGRALDHAAGPRATRPNFAPPMPDRPRKISVTQVETLRADPYAYYARAMLGLEALKRPGEEPDGAWRGTFLHAILAHWGEDGFKPDALIPMLRKGFVDSALHPVVQALWLPRFEEAAESFIAFVEEGRAEGRVPIKTEHRGEIARGGVTLHGRADRIDRMLDGRLAIVDYKTGAPPDKKKTEAGFALQLGLLGKIADENGFADVVGNARVFEHWSQGRIKSDPYGYVKSALVKEGPASEPEFFADFAMSFFNDVLDQYLLGDEPFIAKLHPDYAFSDYDHLMRYEEWRGRDV